MSSIKSLWAALARAPVSEEAAAAAAAREAAELRVAQRRRDILAYLHALWHIGGPRAAHRPTNEDELHRVQAPVLAAAYSNAAGEEQPKEWLLSDACRTLCAQKGWKPIYM